MDLVRILANIVVMTLGGMGLVVSALFLTWLLMGFVWVTAWPPLALLTLFLLGAVGTAVFTVSGDHDGKG